MKTPTAFFYLGDHRNGGITAGYPHLAIVLAEGLIANGWQVSSDVRYWQPSVDGAYLFPGDGAHMAREADLVLFGEEYFLLADPSSLAPILKSVKGHTVYLDRSDMGDLTRLMHRPEFRKLDIIYRCHSSSRFSYPSNVRPNVFGISNRMADACRVDGQQSRSGAIWNFRHSRHPHSVRRWAERHVRPIIASRFSLDDHVDVAQRPAQGYEALMLAQTGGKHSHRYYEVLARALLCACFGGWFLLPLPQTEAGALSLAGRRLFSSLPFSSSVVAQWDSWRLWEAMAAGAAVLHLDFEKYGFLTGDEQPVAMKHYIPVDVTHPAKSLLPLLDDPTLIQQIGWNGMQWARAHFSSVAIARRLLKTLGYQ